jgi:4a-hydroxytetrahydrobiopterin dehydratase
MPSGRPGPIGSHHLTAKSIETLLDCARVKPYAIIRVNMAPAKFNDDEVSAHLSALPLWRLEQGEIVRDLKFDNFAGALEFVNRVGALAESLDHHPDILIHGWNKVRLSVMTHSANGLTEKDFDLAARIDSLK